jgi:hypothetical protein
MPAELGPGPGRVNSLTEQDFGEIAAGARPSPVTATGFRSYVATPSSSCWPGRARIRHGGQHTLASGGPAADLRRRRASQRSDTVSEWAGRMRRRSLREVMSSLVKTLLRWYWTVRGDRNNRAPISGFERPSRASRAI